MKCFNCDQEGHMAWQCGQQAATTPERPDSLAIYRRPVAEISQRYQEWADKIRADMGWAKSSDE